MSTTLARRLPQLAAEINREHQLCEGNYRTALRHALRVGELLSEAKEQLEHGDWLPWLAECTAVSERNAQRYIQLAGNPTPVSGLGIKDALHAIAKPAPPVPNRDPLVQQLLKQGKVRDLPVIDMAARSPALPGWQGLERQFAAVRALIAEAADSNTSPRAAASLLDEAAQATRPLIGMLERLADTVRRAAA